MKFGGEYTLIALIILICMVILVDIFVSIIKSFIQTCKQKGEPYEAVLDDSKNANELRKTSEYNQVSDISPRLNDSVKAP